MTANKKGWELDYRVPVTTVAILAMQTATFGWYAGITTSSINANKANIEKLNEERKADEQEDAERFKEFSGTLYDMSGRLIRIETLLGAGVSMSPSRQKEGAAQ